MSDQYTYARFWRCALQVNPVGYNGTYRGADHGLDEGGYNQALLQKCLELGIKVVGLADHGSVASVDALRQVLQPHGIVVFPGFEIASNDKTHYVCLFPEDTTVQQLDRYLGNLKLHDPADGIRPSRLSSEELIEEVDLLGGFIYAAHCTQESGLLKNRLNHVWKHSKLRADMRVSQEESPSFRAGRMSTVLRPRQQVHRRKRHAVVNLPARARGKHMSNMQKPPALAGQVEPSVGRHPWAAEMLAMMSDRWGTTTGDLAQRHSRLQHWGTNRHQQSASALAVLRQLEAQGVVKKLDNEKPIAWVLVTPNAG